MNKFTQTFPTAPNKHGVNENEFTKFNVDAANEKK